MNRRERRAAGERGRAQDRDRINYSVPLIAWGSRPLPMEEFTFSVGDKPWDQVRIVDGKRMLAAGCSFASVAEAEAADRLDLVRCFVLQRRADGRLVYMERETGEDPAPDEPVAANFEIRIEGSKWAHLHERQQDVMRTFPEGEVWTYDAWLLAILWEHTGGGKISRADAPGALESAFEEMQRFTRETGYSSAALQGADALPRAMLRVPALFRRYLELVEQRKATAS